MISEDIPQSLYCHYVMNSVNGRLSCSYGRITFMMPFPQHPSLITMPILDAVIKLGFMILFPEHQINNSAYLMSWGKWHLHSLLFPFLGANLAYSPNYACICMHR